MELEGQSTAWLAAVTADNRLCAEQDPCSERTVSVHDDLFAPRGIGGGAPMNSRRLGPVGSQPKPPLTT